MFSAFAFSGLLLATRPSELAREEPPPQPDVTLTIVAPDLAGPWKMTAENRSRETVRIAADSRLLWLEVEPRADEETATVFEGGAPRSTNGRGVKPKPPKTVQCKLPVELRPGGVVDERILLLRPGERYEEIFSPALFCFAPKLAAALAPGSRVTAHLGFPTPPPGRGVKRPATGPFVVEPVSPGSAFAPTKELVSDTFTLAPGSPPSSERAALSARSGDDPAAPQIELLVPPRVDTQSDRTLAVPITVKNTGGRSALLHVRRDNLMFQIDGPSESADCGDPEDARTVPRDQFAELKPNQTTSVDVWVNEMCSHAVFDRPGLYRIAVSLSFPKTTDATAVKPWLLPITAAQTVLVRVRQGRLPFYASPPVALGGPR